jgi:ketosteroid isomerase-like protein
VDDSGNGSKTPGDTSPGLEWVDPGELEPADDPLGDTLRAANERYALALSTADAETLCDLFEPDGAIVDGVGPDVLGHEGLRDMAHYARERFAAVAFDLDVEWAKHDPLDPAVAHAAGTWSMAFVPRLGPGAGATARSRGRFAQRWHRGADGTWRLNRDLTLTREDG